MNNIFKHTKTINTFTNSNTNNYKHLIPNFKTPIILTYSTHNHSTSYHIP
ncbi:hypothetical protein G3565_29315 [Escherichia coli]|nr:hypothetical protein [Escherichia coli]